MSLKLPTGLIPPEYHAKSLFQILWCASLLIVPAAFALQPPAYSLSEIPIVLFALVLGASIRLCVFSVVSSNSRVLFCGAALLAFITAFGHLATGSVLVSGEWSTPVSIVWCMLMGFVAYAATKHEQVDTLQKVTFPQLVLAPIVWALAVAAGIDFPSTLPASVPSAVIAGFMVIFCGLVLWTRIRLGVLAALWLDILVSAELYLIAIGTSVAWPLIVIASIVALFASFKIMPLFAMIRAPQQEV